MEDLFCNCKRTQVFVVSVRGLQALRGWNEWTRCCMLWSEKSRCTLTLVPGCYTEKRQEHPGIKATINPVEDNCKKQCKPYETKPNSNTIYPRKRHGSPTSTQSWVLRGLFCLSRVKPSAGYQTRPDLEHACTGCGHVGWPPTLTAALWPPWRRQLHLQPLISCQL